MSDEDDGSDLSSDYSVEGMILNALCIFTHLHTMTIHVAGYYHHQPNFTGKKTKALRR